MPGTGSELIEADNPTGKIAVGECSEHGYIYGDDVQFRFPAQGKCNQCGRFLSRVTLARPEEVRARV